MKKIIVLFSLLIPACLYAQSRSYILKGIVGALNSPAKVYLNYGRDAEEKIISTSIKNGVFQFKGDLKKPLIAAVIIDHEGMGWNKLIQSKNPDFITVYLEPGLIKLESADSIKKATITGSWLNKDNAELLVILGRFDEKLKSLLREASAASENRQDKSEIEANFQKGYDSMQQEGRAALKEFIKLHPQSLISIVALRISDTYSPDYTKSELLFNSLDETLKTSDEGREYAAALTLSKRTTVGAIATDFTQNNADGKPVSLSSFKGKYVLLDFWASWCGPCRKENPAIVKAFNQFKDKNFTILGVSLDERKDAWLKAIENDQLTWTQVSDLKAWKNEVAQLYHVQSVPQNFLLDPAGKIIAKNLHGEALAQKLQEIFGEVGSQ